MPRTTSLVACGVQSPEHGRADTLLRSHHLTTTVRSKFCSQQLRPQVPGM